MFINDENDLLERMHVFMYLVALIVECALSSCMHSKCFHARNYVFTYFVYVHVPVCDVCILFVYACTNVLLSSCILIVCP